MGRFIGAVAALSVWHFGWMNSATGYSLPTIHFKSEYDVRVIDSRLPLHLPKSEIVEGEMPNLFRLANYRNWKWT
jgi:hypothetical protein